MSGGRGTIITIRKAKIIALAVSPANTRIDVRAHGWSRKRPTAVRSPMIDAPAIIAAAMTIEGVEFGGRGADVSRNRDATAIAANIRPRILPSIATIALAVTAMGLRMRIIYFFVGGALD